MTRHRSLVVLLLFGVAAPVWGESWDPFGSAAAERPQGSVGGLFYLRSDLDTAHDYAGENRWSLYGRGLVEGRVRRPGRWRLLLSGTFLYEVEERGANKATWTPELWEAYALWERPAWELAVGQAIRRWGRGIPSLLDVLNPADLSQIFFVEDEFTKRPVPMVRWTRYGDGYELELVWLPFYRPARLPRTGSDWSPLAIQDLEGASELVVVQQALEQEIYPGIVTMPPDDLLHGEAGLRFSPAVPGMDLDFVLFVGYEDIAPPRFTPGFLTYLRAQPAGALATLRNLSIQEIAVLNPIYVQQPRRQWIGAVGAARPVGPWTLRVEGALTSRQSVYAADLNLIAVPLASLLFGVDALTSDHLLYTVTTSLVTFLTDEELYLLPRFNVLVGGLLRWRPSDADLWLELRGLWDATQGDAWLGPSLLYELADGWQLQGGLNVIEGVPPTPLSNFDHNDFVYLRSRWSF